MRSRWKEMFFFTSFLILFCGLFLCAHIYFGVPIGISGPSGSEFYMHLVIPDELAGTPEGYRILEKDETWRECNHMVPYK
jgi:hypothetical protein